MRTAGYLPKIIISMGLFAIQVPPLAATTQPRPTAPTGPTARKPTHPRTAERKDERQNMVTQQVAARGVRDARVLEAMRNVPRHWFVPAQFTAMAYQDRPLTIGHDQTISQPYIVALMTELLKLKPGGKVL